MINKGFILCAGFGTRFQPQTNFIPKPALPFFNLPIAVYPAGLLKMLGTHELIYNSHHLANELERSLSPYIKTKPFYEDPIFDSAGGILNAAKDLVQEENFWVINGDSLICTKETEEINQHVKDHITQERLATFFCIEKPQDIKSGLVSNSQGNLVEISSSSEAKHFIGLYLLNKRIFEHIKTKPSHIFRDVIIPLIRSEKIHVAHLSNKTRWLETGSEKAFVDAHISETDHIFNETDDSFISKIHQLWNPEAKKDLHSFLNSKVWGSEERGHVQSKFNCVPKNFDGNLKLLKNCVVTTKALPSQQFENRVLVDASQWD